MATKSYIIRVSLQEEANEGWVWISGFPPRSIIKIEREGSGHWVVCQCRQIDQNFTEVYDNDIKGRRFPLKEPEQTIVMSGWYREALGGLGTTGADDQTGRANLKVSQYRLWPRAQVLAGSHHPDVVVRLGVRLGLLSIWLGLLGAILGAVSLFQSSRSIPLICGALLLLAVAVAFLLVSRGPNRIK